MPTLRRFGFRYICTLLTAMLLQFADVRCTCTRNNCLPPDCFCASLSGPAEIPVSETPQIVLLSFDDAVLPDFEPLYKELFDSGRRRNPNGCPITATFYVTHEGTDYRLVNRLYSAGHEMASHSVSHRMPQSNWTRAPYKQWLDEIGGQRDKLVKLGGVKFEDVRGMRAPFLETGGDEQYRMMADAGFEYDSSFMVGPHGSSGGAWPFTLDFAPIVPTYCTNLNCPRRPHPAIWQLPLNRWLGRSGRPCAMVDSCDSAAQPEAGRLGDALAYFWHNFGRFYRGNRAPFGVHLHADWLLHNPEYFEAFLRFLKTLLADFDDVYFVTSHQAIEWMKQPRTIDEARSFLPWTRSCNIGNATSSRSSTLKSATHTENQSQAEKTETLVLYQPQNTEPSEVKDNRKKLVDSRQRPSDIRTISNVLRPPLPEIHEVQPSITIRMPKTAEVTSTTSLSTPSTTTTTTNQATPPQSRWIPVRWVKSRRDSQITPSSAEVAVASKRGAAKRMRSNVHSSTSTTTGHCVTTITSLSIGVVYLCNRI